MPINPDHLLALAREGANPSGLGAPQQAVLRRAVSTAYYAVFHCLCVELAQTFQHGDERIWHLVYRTPEHRELRRRCERLGRDPLGEPEQSFFSPRFFGVQLRNFANAFVDLQAMRHQCDYDPEFRITKHDAQTAVRAAEAAVASLRLPDANKPVFLAYLLLKLRSDA